MIDVCLIYLPKPYLKQPDAQQPLGLLYIADSLEKAGKKVVIQNYTKYSCNEIKYFLPKAKLYGITATSLELPYANKVARIIKTLRHDATVIIGGPGTLHKDLIDLEYVDTIVKGEGEEIIKHLLENVETDKKNARCYQSSPVNVDKYTPARHLIKNQGGNIFAFDKNYYPGGSTVILSSRGCPFPCAFCSAPALTYQKKVRFRNPLNIREEIQSVIKDYGIRQFRFSDDMFTASKEHVFNVCNAIGDLDIAWRISCRVKPISDDILKAMKEAGCKELSFGIESFDNDVLKGLKKHTTAEDNQKALKLAHKHGFTTRILFMIRTPFQTRKTIALNKYYIKRVPYDIIACTAFIPIPGCDIWNNPDNYNIEILDKDIEKYNFYMYGPDGRRKIDKIINIKGRDINEYHKESEDFRDWIENIGKVNKG